MSGTEKDAEDELHHFKRQQQVYLTHYQTRLGGLFSIDVYPTELQAARNAAAFADDGYPARVLKVTVVDGDPVAEWVEESAS